MQRYAIALMCAVLLATWTPVATAQTDTNKPWRVRITTGGGYNSNAAARGNAITQATVPGLKGRGSAFGRFTFDGSYDIYSTDMDLVTVGYGLHADIYEGGLEEANVLTHNGWVGYQRLITDDLSVSLQLANENTTIGGNEFLNSILIEPSVYYRFAEWGAIDIGYTARFMEYDFAVIAPGVDRDGVQHKLGFKLHLDVPDTQLDILLGYSRTWNFTEGGNGGQYDYDGNELTVGLSHPLPLDISADLTWTRRWDDYQAIGPAPGIGRADRTDFYSLVLTKPINDHLKFYTRYDHIEAQSNATLFDYRQRVIASGLIIEF